jgi:hypothetical protein
MRKITQFVLSAALALGLIASASASFTFYNTGVDDSNALLAGGAVDSHWSIISAPSPFGPSAYVANPIPDIYIDNTATAQWIAPQTAQGLNDFNTAGIYTYRQTFDLTGFDASTATLSGLISSDNDIMDILINGVSTGFTTPFEAPNGFDVFHAFAFNSGFVDGINTFDVIVRNGYPQNLQRYHGPTALIVDGIVTTADRIVPEPSTYAMMVAALALAVFVARRRKLNA